MVSGGSPIDFDKRRRSYLFIDGGYFRKRRSDMFIPVFGTDSGTNYSAIARDLECSKGFYYDCPDEKLAAETPEAFDARRDAQFAEFQRIRSFPGFHVVNGTLSNRRQKEVDVALTVDMLMHAHSKNMTYAHLIAGDLDFRPLVKALVQLGVYLTLWYQKSAIATELQFAVDHARELDFNLLYQWSTDEFKTGHPIPRPINAYEAPDGGEIASGTSPWGGPVQMFYSPPKKYTIVAHDFANGLPLTLWWEDREFLERYFTSSWGPIIWNPNNGRLQAR